MAESVLTARRHLSKSRQLVFRYLRGKRILLCGYRSPWDPGMRGDLERFSGQCTRYPQLLHQQDSKDPAATVCSDMKTALEEQDYNSADLIQALRHSAAGIGDLSRLPSNYMSASKVHPAHSLATPSSELHAQSCRITLSTSRLLQHAAHAIQHPNLASTQRMALIQHVADVHLAATQLHDLVRVVFVAPGIT